MKTAGILSLLAVWMCVTVLPAYAENDDLTTLGDVLSVALPLAAFGGTFYYDDPEGRAQFLVRLFVPA